MKTISIITVVLLSLLSLYFYQYLYDYVYAFPPKNAPKSDETTDETTSNVSEETVSIALESSNPSSTEFYVPSEITVSSGNAVTWTNDDTTIHTVTEGSPQGGSGATPAFDSSIIAPGETWESIFDTPGDFDYYCTLHPFMTGKVTVT